MKYIIEKDIKINLELEVYCRRCEVLMNNTGNLTTSHLYFGCPKCNTVITINLDIKN